MVETLAEDEGGFDRDEVLHSDDGGNADRDEFGSETEEGVGGGAGGGLAGGEEDEAGLNALASEKLGELVVKGETGVAVVVLKVEDGLSAFIAEGTVTDVVDDVVAAVLVIAEHLLQPFEGDGWFEKVDLEGGGVGRVEGGLQGGAFEVDVGGGQAVLLLDVGGIGDEDEEADGAFVDGATPGQGDGQIAGEGGVGVGGEQGRAILELFPGQGVEFGGEGVDAQADAAMGSLATGFSPGGAQIGVGEQSVEKALAVGGEIAGGGPGEDVGGEVSARELLLAPQGDLDRVACVFALEDADLQVNQVFINRMIRHLNLTLTRFSSSWISLSKVISPAPTDWANYCRQSARTKL